MCEHGMWLMCADCIPPSLKVLVIIRNYVIPYKSPQHSFLKYCKPQFHNLASTIHLFRSAVLIKRRIWNGFSVLLQNHVLIARSNSSFPFQDHEQADNICEPKAMADTTSRSIPCLITRPNKCMLRLIILFHHISSSFLDWSFSS